MFKVHFGMSVGHLETEYTDTKCKQQPKIPGVRGKHIRIVLAPALIYGMFQSGLLGGATMEQVIWLYELTCVDSALG